MTSPSNTRTQRQVHCHPYVKLVASHPGTLHSTEPATHTGPWTLPALCASYNWPNNKVGGGIIAIVELGGGWSPGDMAAFFGGIGQPVPHIVDVSVDGTENSGQNPNNDADYEVALDIQVAGAAYYLATGKPATIRVYWAQDIAPAVIAAMKDGCHVCSISWGNDEAAWGNLAVQQMETAAKAATAAGMVVFAASGDNDSSDGGPNSANVDAPASCPHVIGCGGTKKTGKAETVWNDNPNTSNGEGTGGGYSTVFPAQAWQVGAPKAPKGLGRMVPDVAANADPVTGYEITVYGGQTVVGGTSAVAPLYAGLFAALGKGIHLGFVTPDLWRNQGWFEDVTVGNNGTYSAEKGPDACTGVGVMNGNAIAGFL